jgi:hypothetical protein
MSLPESMRCLCAKEVGAILGVSERSALRLMSSGQIESFRCGGKLWRTTTAKVKDYQEREFERYRRHRPAA